MSSASQRQYNRGGGDNPCAGLVVQVSDMAKHMTSRTRFHLRTTILTSATALMLAIAGCTAVGAIAANLEREGSREVAASYKGLAGKSFAVVVAADRTIQGDHPLIIEHMIERITARLSEPSNVPAAGGYVPAVQVAKYLSEHPSWTAQSMKALAGELGGVERIVYIDLFEFRLNDPGNAYLWDGRASANVSVVETDSAMDDFFAFQQTVSVGFPDKQGLGPSDMQASGVRTELARRLIERASWLFYDHTEMNKLEY